jgi:8-oxo-dGTP diphosphatase
VAVVVVHDSKVLLGRRLNHPQPGSWQLPGGWIWQGESPIEAVQRKLSEFPGMRLSAIEFLGYTNNLFDHGDHSISLYFETHCQNAKRVQLSLNPDCNDWLWADWYDLPQPLFHPLQSWVETGFKPELGNSR